MKKEKCFLQLAKIPDEIWNKFGFAVALDGNSIWFNCPLYAYLHPESISKIWNTDFYTRIVFGNSYFAFPKDDSPVEFFTT